MESNFTGRTITIQSPKRLVFGNGCSSQFIDDFATLGLDRAFIVTAPPILQHVKVIVDSLKKEGLDVEIWDKITNEPTIKTFEGVLKTFKTTKSNAVIGIGGGSVLDVAKLVAALNDRKQDIHEVFGIKKLSGRSTYLSCLPTTAGTGSEVSPNSILLDESANLKKGVVSPYLVPDAVYIDPLLTVTVPPSVTGSTGMDALTHCIEAYVNRFAHPMIDLYALEGIRLIGSNLELAYKDGNNIEARAKMSLGSLYGGLCLGSVNTGAVHALAYPLGGEFHIPHGVSNALLLPYVLEFNLSAAPHRYAQIAQALGIEPASSDLETARKGVNKLKKLSSKCGIPAGLSEVGVPRDAIKEMAELAMSVTRLLKNNPKKLTRSDAEEIYNKAY